MERGGRSSGGVPCHAVHCPFVPGFDIHLGCQGTGLGAGQRNAGARSLCSLFGECYQFCIGTVQSVRFYYGRWYIYNIISPDWPVPIFFGKNHPSGPRSCPLPSLVLSDLPFLPSNLAPVFAERHSLWKK